MCTYLTLHKTVVITDTIYCDVNTIFIHAVSLWTSLNFVNDDFSGSIIDPLICNGDSVSFLGFKRENYVLFKHLHRLLIHLQSALQPLWVLACSTIVEYSQQEGFYRVPLPVARQTPNLEDQ